MAQESSTKKQHTSDRVVAPTKNKTDVRNVNESAEKKSGFGQNNQLY